MKTIDILWQFYYKSAQFNDSMAKIKASVINLYATLH